jgi:hypothetical protein
MPRKTKPAPQFPTLKSVKPLIEDCHLAFFRLLDTPGLSFGSRKVRALQKARYALWGFWSQLKQWHTTKRRGQTPDDFLAIHTERIKTIITDLTTATNEIVRSFPEPNQKAADLFAAAGEALIKLEALTLEHEAVEIAQLQATPQLEPSTPAATAWETMSEEERTRRLALFFKLCHELGWIDELELPATTTPAPLPDASELIDALDAALSTGTL